MVLCIAFWCFFVYNGVNESRKNKKTCFFKAINRMVLCITIKPYIWVYGFMYNLSIFDC